MKVLVDTSFILRNKTGVGNYILYLFKMFKSLGIDYKAVPVEFLWKFPFNKLPLKYIPYHFWLNTGFFAETLKQKPNFVIDAHYFFPYIKRKGTKYIGTIYDLVNYKFPETMPDYWVKFISYGMGLTVKNADTILTISETVKQEILEKFDIDANKIKIVYPTCDDIFFSDINDAKVLEKYGIKDTKYLLSVATLNKRKNTEAIVQAFQKISQEFPEIKLLLVGDSNRLTKAMGLDTSKGNIIFTGYVEDEELPTLYKNALAFVFPSLYEGFGIPVLEAQASRTPVICSDIPVLREVGADTVLYCSHSSDSVAEKMREIISNPELRKSLIEKGAENTKRFNADVIKNQIKELFKISQA